MSLVLRAVVRFPKYFTQYVAVSGRDSVLVKNEQWRGADVDPELRTDTGEFRELLVLYKQGTPFGFTSSYIGFVNSTWASKTLPVTTCIYRVNLQ